MAEFRYPHTAQETLALIARYKGNITVKRKRRNQGYMRNIFLCGENHHHADIISACICEAKRLTNSPPCS